MKGRLKAFVGSKLTRKVDGKKLPKAGRLQLDITEESNL